MRYADTVSWACAVRVHSCRGHFDPKHPERLFEFLAHLGGNGESDVLGLSCRTCGVMFTVRETQVVSDTSTSSMARHIVRIGWSTKARQTKLVTYVLRKPLVKQPKKRRTAWQKVLKGVPI